MRPIPLNSRANIELASIVTGCSVDEIYNLMRKSAEKEKQEYIKQSALNFFGKDEKWYDETLKKIEQIESTLDKNIDGEERIIKLYGWIAQEMPDKNFIIPMSGTREFSIAYCVMLRLTDPDGYRKIINWE